MNKEILNRYLNGSATKAERESVLRWAEASPANREELERLKAQWVFDHLPSSAAPEGAIIKMRKRLGRSGSSARLIMRIAAVLFIPLAIFAFYQRLQLNDLKEKLAFLDRSVNYQTGRDSLIYTVHTGVKGLVDLPDGSKVWLNSGSSIKCPAMFADNQRDVELDGEGYFIVKGDPEWPMFIATKRKITIKVTGTEFNLTSYANDTELRLTLVKGNVAILNEKDNSEILVKPMEEIVIPDRMAPPKLRQQADVHLNTAWKEGFLLFDNTPMDEVIKRMERWYGVKFIISDSSILNNNFTGEFKSESLSQVLDFLKKSSFIGYKIEETTVTLSRL